MNRPALLKRLVAREQLSSTALDNGFAIPHTSRTGPRLVPRNVVAFVRTAQPIPFGAPGGGLADLLFFVFAADQSTHLALLVRVASLARFSLMGRQLPTATSPREVLDLVDRAERLLFDRPGER